MPVRILLDVPITYDVGSETTHAPMVAARIGAATTRLILDTGSSDHVFTIEFARAAGLSAVPGESGVDHAGAPVPSWRLGDVRARIGELTVALADAVAIVGPPPFEGWGVGGFLSPQHLHPEAAVVIDLVAHRLVLVDGDDDAVAAWLDERWPGLSRLTLARDVEDPTPVVAAAIEPFAPGPTMLNTGGRTTEFTTASVGGLRGRVPERLGKGVGGQEVLATEISDRVLRVGAARFAVPALLVRETIGTLAGLVGMDVLRGTVLVGRRRSRPGRDLARPSARCRRRRRHGRRRGAARTAGHVGAGARARPATGRGRRFHPARLLVRLGRRRMHPAIRTRGRPVPSFRPRLRRASAFAIVVAFLAGALAVPLLAANTSVTGTLTFREKIALTPAAVAIVTIVDTAAAPDAGSVIGQQRIDGPTALPIDFSVLIDADAIDQTHAYALFATIIDAGSTWENPVGEPVITGGPVKGIDLTLTALPATPPAAIGGTIVLPEATTLDAQAVSIAALIKVETGTLVARQVRPIAAAAVPAAGAAASTAPSAAPAAPAFSIGFDPALIDPTATYVVKGGIVDGAAVWQNREGVPAIQGGVAVPTVSLSVTRAATDLPVASAAPSGPPSTAPSTAPSSAPTALPSSTRGSHHEPDDGSNGRPDRDAGTDTDPDRDPDRRRRPHADRHALTDADPDRYAIADADGHAQSIGAGLERTLADAGRGRDRDADVSRAVHPDRGRVRGRGPSPGFGAGDRDVHRRVDDRS